jgi:hypothetical protein
MTSTSLKHDLELQSPDGGARLALAQAARPSRKSGPDKIAELLRENSGPEL